MDEYTQKTKDWLDARFRETDRSGVYNAHQPIYGFRKGPCEFGQITRYVRTYQIMRALSRLKFKSLVDVGAAEGYKGALARELFEAEATCSDLSEEACKRAQEIYRLRAVPADVHALPFKDGEFDVSLCSETLEHVTDYKVATAELLRVAKIAAIVTVPHEPETKIDANIEAGEPHAHIHSFDFASFDYLKQSGIDVYAYRVHSQKLVIPAVLVDAMPVQHSSRWKFPRIVSFGFNLAIPILRLFSNKHTAARMIEQDEQTCLDSNDFTGLLFMLVKEKASFLGDDVPKIPALKVVEFAVPPHILRS